MWSVVRNSIDVLHSLSASMDSHVNVRGPEGLIHYGDSISLADQEAGGFVACDGMMPTLYVEVVRGFKAASSIPR